MTDDLDMARRKYEMLKRAVEQAKEQEDMQQDDMQQDDDVQDSTLDELKAAAFEVLLLNPGTMDQSEWADILVEQYGTEVVDAYGNYPPDVNAALADLWESPYYDKNSGLEYDYKDWAEAFATDASVQMYYDLTDSLHKLSTPKRGLQ